ncbi:MAG: dihydroorotase [Prevotella sp.]|nr:dihydroorotase [Prevotella sp.]
MSTLIYGGNIVNEGAVFQGSIVIENDRIAHIDESNDTPRGIYDNEVDATGCFVMPGVIDEHVHFREPGLTHKADIASESRAAACGGVTTYFDMPNTVPQTTTIETLEDKFRLAKGSSLVNYSFFPGATTANVQLFEQLDRHRIPGIKLFMGASTGNMLVDGHEALCRIFETCARLGLPLMTHCEDTALINANMAAAKERYGDDPAIQYHPQIRSEEACYRSTELAVSLARTYATRLHVAHVTTARELSLFGDDAHITAEAVVAHLLFTDADYTDKGAQIKCNPAVKTLADRTALRCALTDGRIYTVATDHAPHQWADKQGGCARAASGMPMLQFSLPSMLGLVDEGVLTLPQLVALMCHHPAQLFGVRNRGYLRQGYKADIAIVKPHQPWTVTPAEVQSKCGWSPLMGHEFQWRVLQTICNGHVVYDRGHLDTACRGEEVCFG